MFRMRFIQIKKSRRSPGKISSELQSQTRKLLWVTLTFSLALPTSFLLLGKTLLKEQRWVHFPVPSSIEITGSLIAFLVAMLLVTLGQQKKGTKFNLTLEAKVNKKTSALMNSQIELIKINKKLECVIVDHKNTQQQLQHHVKKLERSNQELDDFTYIASHDLKEPLREISNYSGFLVEDYVDALDEDGVKKLKTLQGLSKRMSNYIDSPLY